VGIGVVKGVDADVWRTIASFVFSFLFLFANVNDGITVTRVGGTVVVRDLEEEEEKEEQKKKKNKGSQEKGLKVIPSKKYYNKKR
jgi:Na+-transporting methylmalonyl-CoA/oxaloacetate decarboxylase gamma subunit